MSLEMDEILRRFHKALVREIRKLNPGYLDTPFTVAEIYQNLVPYRTHREEIGVEMSADYEDALMRLLAGEGDYLVIESKEARQAIRDELEAPNPNTGIFRDFAAADVLLNPEMLASVREEEVLASGSVTAELELEAVYDTFDDVFQENRPEVEPSEPAEEVAPLQDLDLGAVEGAAPTEYESGEAGAFEEEIGETLDLPDAEVMESAPTEEIVEEEVTEVLAEEVASESTGPCPWCRESLPGREHLKFCPFCGSNLNLVPCPECGEELELKWRFCVSCGTEVGK